MKKKYGFLVAVTENIIFAAGNIALALDKYMHGKDYELIVYYASSKKNDIYALENIPNCIPKEFTPNDALVEYLLKNLPKKCPYKTRNQLMLLCHYEIFKLLDDYEAVAWLDADILVQGDLSEMFLYEPPFAITADTPWRVRDQFIEPPKIRIEEYDLDRDAVCSAVMVAHDTLPYNKIYDWLIETTFKYADCLKNIDQVAINLMLQEFNILPSLMPPEKFQCIQWEKESITANIVHFGPKKIWDNPDLCWKFSEWYRNHKVWVSLGGSDQKNLKSIPKFRKKR